MEITYLLLTITAVWNLAVGQVDDPCPSNSEISPCYCTTDYTGYSVTVCERVHDLNRIREVLNKMRGKNISLYFEKSRLGDIPSDFFEGQISTDVSFDHCQIGSFGDTPFSGLENTLTSIYVYFSVDKRRKDLETFPLGHLKKLRSLMFQGNDIKRLGNEWFQGGPTTLTYLSLEANDIEELGDKAFVSLVNLEQIWLGDNRYKVVSRSMFPNPAPKLFLLEMSFSEVEVIPEDMFTGMPSLNSINVSGNKLVTLPESTWGHVWNRLEEVYVDRNRLECDKRLLWIYKRKLPKILDGKCYGYNKLRGRKLKELTPEDFDF